MLTLRMYVIRKLLDLIWLNAKLAILSRCVHLQLMQLRFIFCVV